ncbi:ABC transporter permease subunit [Candidatus Micrarchaeota archaeon]|nr:ABC transporter permease subunit [Candidatus Micrarchaeota archaeon]
MEHKTFIIFALIVALLSFLFLGNQVYSLPSFVLLTFLRMLGAYALCIIFSVPIGILVGHNDRASKILVPILDILQSVPVLGFLPFAILFLINNFPGGYIGTEVAAIFLIFTSMTWAIVFNTIEGIKTIPNDVRDASRLVGLDGLRYIFEVVLPAIYPAFISGSMTAWGGGWYFLVAGEFMSLGAKQYVLPGVGSFIAQSAYSGDINHSLLGIGILATMVLFMNTFVWRPLLVRSKKFSFESSAYSGMQVSNDRTPITSLVEAAYSHFKRFALSVFYPLLRGPLNYLNIDAAHFSQEKSKLSKFEVFLILLIFSSWTALLFLFPPNAIGGKVNLLEFALSSCIRIAIAYGIALLWTLAVGIWIGRNQKLLDIFMPLFDIGQSIPAIAVFPLVVVVVIHLIGPIGIELASIILLLTGTQWYLLFNIIRAVQQVPGDILEAAAIMKLKKREIIKNIMLPAVFPAVTFASIQAIGGAWNATIVSEYIVSGSETYHTAGLGYMLDLGASTNNIALMALAVLSMVTIIILLNKLFWSRIIAQLYKYRF